MSVAHSNPAVVAAAATSSVFPLPLSTMEAFMVMDSRPGYGMHCDLLLDFQGRIDRAAFETGLAFALDRNPLFHYTIGRQPNGKLAWQDSGQSPPVQWISLDDPLDDSYGATFDLTSRPGLRIWVLRGDDESKVLLHFHHACGDGLGVNGFIEDLLVGYHNAFPGDAPIEPRPLEVERLRTRGEMGMGGRSLWRQFTDVFVGAREGGTLLLQQPVSIASTRSLQPSDPAAALPLRPFFVSARLSEATTRGLRQLAKQTGATTNDVLMRDLFLALARWNQSHGGLPAGKRLRILMPQNLREDDDYKMPLSNAISFAFVSRTASWCARPAELLDSIRQETEAIREGKLSLYFLGCMETMRSFGLLQRIADGPFGFGTAILTNIGDPSRQFIAKLPRSSDGVQAGNVTYSGMVGVPPTRPRTGVVFTIANHGATMSVTYRWDPHRIDPQTGRQILDAFIAQLDATACEVTASDANRTSVG
jgi:hypothetical protein